MHTYHVKKTPLAFVHGEMIYSLFEISKSNLVTITFNIALHL